MSKKKKPLQEKQLSKQKRPRGGEKPRSTESETITWHIGILDQKGTWGWRKMRHFESMTWASIEASKRNSSIPVSNLSPAARIRLHQIKQDDIDVLFHLGLSGKERVWGIRDGRVLRILWWGAPQVRRFVHNLLDERSLILTEGGNLNGISKGW